MLAFVLDNLRSLLCTAIGICRKKLLKSWKNRSCQLKVVKLVCCWFDHGQGGPQTLIRLTKILGIVHPKMKIVIIYSASSSKHLLVAIHFHSMGKKILWKSMATGSCCINNVLFLLSTIFIFYFFTHNITEYPK